jgi:hypothetical protein
MVSHDVLYDLAVDDPVSGVLVDALKAGKILTCFITTIPF